MKLSLRKGYWGTNVGILALYTRTVRLLPFIDEPEAAWSVSWLATLVGLGRYITYHPTLSRSNTQTILKDGLAAVTKILSGFPHRGAYLKRSSSFANR